MFTTTLISSEQHWAILAILFIVATLALRAGKTKWGAHISTAVIAILGTFGLSNLAIIPTSAPVYDLVWSYLVPVAIPLLLFQANLSKILHEAGPTLIAFIMGTIGTILGTLLAFHFIPLGEAGWKLAGVFGATYIGGSLNFMATAEAIQLQSGDLLTASVAADNLMMTVYFLILLALPTVTWLSKWFVPTAPTDLVPTESLQPAKTHFDLFNLAKALTLSLTICASGFGLADLIPIQGSAILIITVMVVTLATLLPNQISAIQGADQIGILFMHLFFAVIGASANIMAVLKVGPILFLFAGFILLVHLLFILITGKLLKLKLNEILIASNANMGGPTTAAAMAAANQWENLVIPAILCGTLGYVIATFIGIGIALGLQP